MFKVHFVEICVLGLALLLTLNWRFSSDTSSVSRLAYSKYSAADDDVVAALKPKGTTIAATELFYMLPKTDAKGVLIYFHGCNHGGQDFFYLPEHRLVAKAALDSGLAVLSPSSRDRKRGCWDKKRDMEFLPNIVTKWLENVNLPVSLPRVGMGASSGGSFLFTAYEELQLSSLASYVSPNGFPEVALQENPEKLPPTVFVHMPRDSKTEEAIQRHETALKKANVTAEVFEVHPRPLTPEVCRSRIPELGDQGCNELFSQIRSNHPNILDEEYHVKQSYFRSAWGVAFEESQFLGPPARRERSEVKEVPRGVLSTVQFAGYSWLWASMVEEVAVSYAFHAMTAEHRHHVFEFLMKNANINGEFTATS